MFTGVYKVFSGKSVCRDFRIAGFTCVSAFSINSVGVSFMVFAGHYKSKICMQYSTDNVDFTYKTYKETQYCIDFPKISINFIRICSDFPVNSKMITCNACLFFSLSILFMQKTFAAYKMKYIPKNTAD